jgi:hypothetical protein
MLVAGCHSELFITGAYLDVSIVLYRFYCNSRCFVPAFLCTCHRQFIDSTSGNHFIALHWMRYVSSFVCFTELQQLLPISISVGMCVTYAVSCWSLDFVAVQTYILAVDSWSYVRSSSFCKKKMQTFEFDGAKRWSQLDWSICWHIVISITKAPTVQSIWWSGISQRTQFQGK